MYNTRVVQLENIVWNKPQRGSSVVLNSFTPYSWQQDVRRRKQDTSLPVLPEVWQPAQRGSAVVTNVNYNAGAQINYASRAIQIENIYWNKPNRGLLSTLANYAITADIFVGQDTYGWPNPEPVVWAPANRGALLTVSTPFIQVGLTQATVGLFTGAVNTADKLLALNPLLITSATGILRFGTPVTVTLAGQSIASTTGLHLPDTLVLFSQGQTIASTTGLVVTVTGSNVTVPVPSLSLAFTSGTIVAYLNITPGFRVQAVTAGWYGGYYYQAGDVFDLLSGTDFSDSTQTYQGPLSGTSGVGWMLQVPQSTPLYQFETSEPIPSFPSNDPNRRFVY
jgi:hypothetical protein